MYKQVETYKKAIDKNGNELTPVATLESENGGVAHFYTDDHCYVLGLERDSSKNIEKGEKQFPKETHLVNHIFPEAFEVLKSLPDLTYA